jgi:subtilisin family serine protease
MRIHRKAFPFLGLPRGVFLVGAFLFLTMAPQTLRSDPTTSPESSPSGRIDPYLAYAFSKRSDALHIMGARYNSLLSQMDTTDPGPTFPMLLRVRDPEKWQPPKGFEVRGQIGSIVSGLGVREAYDALAKDPNVLRIDGSREYGTTECAHSVPFIRAKAVHDPPLNERGKGALIAIIDSGVDVLHKAFLDEDGKSRIVGIWNQWGTKGPWPSEVYSGLKANYGTVHKENQIQSFVRNNKVEDEDLARRASHNNGHGTHVASIAAGRKVRGFSGGVAPEAKLVIVIPKVISERTDSRYNPNSVGYSSGHVDALTYINAVAQEMKLPVVVNMSIGKNAGAHDGTTPLELAFDALTDRGRRPGVSVVKSAGNQREKDLHAKLIMGSKSRNEIKWESQYGNERSEDLMELWFNRYDEFHFRLIAPHGDYTEWVNWKDVRVDKEFHTTRNRGILTYVRNHVDNNDSCLYLQIDKNEASHIEPGHWTLEIETGQVYSGEIHAWLEENDDDPVKFTTHEDEEMTITIPGTAHTVITVGACHSAFPLEPTVGSSFGPTRDLRSKPDLVAPGTCIVAAMAGAKKGEGVTCKTGTSFAAPHVTGAIALLFSHIAAKRGLDSVPNTWQVLEALTKNTQNYNGRFSPIYGYGVLDVKALLAAFD